MSYQQRVFALIAKLGGSKDKAVIDPTLCKFMGSLEGGVFLSQLLYWSDKGRNGAFYKTYQEWEAEIFLSKYHVKKAADKCVEMGFLETWVQKAEGDPTVHYRILQDEFIDKILAFVEIESQKFNFLNENENFDKRKSKTRQSSTETTAKTNGQRSMRPSKGRKAERGRYSDEPPVDPPRKYSV